MSEKEPKTSNTFAEAKTTDAQSIWDSEIPEGGLPRIPTGVPGFDEVLHGGVPAGRSVLIAGTAGSGKTVLLSQFIYQGIVRFNENGVFVTFEETPEQIIANARSLGWRFDALIEQDKLVFVFVPPERDSTVETGNYDWISGLLTRINNAVKKTGARRVVVDSMGTFFGRFSKTSDLPAIRYGIYNFLQELKQQGITVFVTGERTSGQSDLSRYGVEEFVSDGIFDLETHQGQNRMVRSLTVSKLRGASYRSGRVEFEIGPGGIRVFPKIPVDTAHAITDFSNRYSMGIADLDRAMGGGLPQGHILLVAGNTGTGKSILGMHFVNAGVRNDHPCVWVALEEPVPQVKKTALAHGWNFDAYEKQGKLSFVISSLLDVSPDRLLYDILDHVEKHGAKRVVIDSVSSLESGAMSREAVRDFLIQAAGFFKTRGLCCVMNYLTTESFGAAKGLLLGGAASNDMRLSSIVDAIILLRFVEQDQGVQKLMNILKLRGSEHVKDILQYQIQKGGISLGRRFGIMEE